MANVVEKNSISSELAQKMVDEALAKARKIGVTGATKMIHTHQTAPMQFSVAYITALVSVEFAAKAINFAVADEHRSLNRWYGVISSRSSVAA
jgi:hypothetical protein